MKVRELMSTQVETLDPDDDLDLANALMRLDRTRHLPVLAHGELVGMISDRDILKAQVSSLSGLTDEELRQVNLRIKVHEIMTTNVLSVTPETSAREAAKVLRVRKVGCLPVLDDGHLVGIVTATDFLDLVIRVLGD